MDVAQLIIDHAPGAFSICDLAGNYRWVSAGFRTVLGYTEQDLLGHNAYEFIHPEDHAAGQSAHARLFQATGPVVLRCRLRAADGTYRWIETSMRVVRDQQVIVSTSQWVDGEESAVQVLQAERELADRRRAIDDQHRHFLTAVSHRARHPVTIIRGMAELLQIHDAKLDAEQRTELMARIAANSAALAELIEDVTQAQQLAQRAERVEVRPVNLQALLRDCLADLADDDAPITVTVPSDLVVFSDEGMLRLACKALLQNAIDHTPFDTPIWVTSQQAHDGTIITVKDAGPGVPAELRTTIFEPFHRGDPQAPDPGLGLGLHAVAEIAAVHGGRVWVEERDGGGAAFKLLLPTPAAQAVATRRTQVGDVGLASTDTTTADTTPRIVAAPHVRVLVVDDDHMVTELMATTLEVDGFEVEVAHDGVEALERITESAPDLVVCDVGMPRMGGRELVTTIRTTPGITELPVILCSAQSDHESQWRAWSGGADSFIAKPFAPDRLVSEVIRVLTERRAARTPTRPGAVRASLPRDPDTRRSDTP